MSSTGLHYVYTMTAGKVDCSITVWKINWHYLIKQNLCIFHDSGMPLLLIYTLWKRLYMCIQRGDMSGENMA